MADKYIVICDPDNGKYFVGKHVREEEFVEDDTLMVRQAYDMASDFFDKASDAEAEMERFIELERMMGDIGDDAG